MQIIPVLDLMGGQVVRGIAGRRAEYRPIISKLTSSTAPLDVARAFRQHFNFTKLYLADLDAIAGKSPALGIFIDLLRDGFSLWVDAGIGKNGQTLQILDALGIQTLVAGLESLQGPSELQRLVERFGKSRLVFSLDLMDGQPLGNAAAWNFPDAWVIAQQAIHLGIERIFVLDLVGVGRGQGSKTKEFCGRLRSSFPHLEITTGGGVRGESDLVELQTVGVTYVLVASALHDGGVRPQAVLEFTDRNLPRSPAGSG